MQKRGGNVKGWKFFNNFLKKFSFPCTSLLRLLIFPAMNDKFCLLCAVIILIKRKIFTLSTASCLQYVLQLSRNDLIISNGNSQLTKISYARLNLLVVKPEGYFRIWIIMAHCKGRSCSIRR